MSELSTTNPVLNEAPLKFTAGALAEIKTLIYEKEVPADHALRVGVKGGGCSGMSYILGFDVIKDTDDVYEVEGIKMVMNKAHGLYLAGMEVDYVSGLDNRGFVFNNPNASSTCGCGTSFAV